MIRYNDSITLVMSTQRDGSDWVDVLTGKNLCWTGCWSDLTMVGQILVDGKVLESLYENFEEYVNDVTARLFIHDMEKEEMATEDEQ